MLLQLFEQLKNFILARRNARVLKGGARASLLTDLDIFLLGALCKLFATGITYPCTPSFLAIFLRPASPGSSGTLLRTLTPHFLCIADLTVKARMQSGAVEGRSYATSLDGLTKILRTEGVAGLYKGVGPKLTQSVATVRLSPFVLLESTLGGYIVPRRGPEADPFFNRPQSCFWRRRRFTRVCPFFELLSLRVAYSLPLPICSYGQGLYQASLRPRTCFSLPPVHSQALGSVAVVA